MLNVKIIRFWKDSTWIEEERYTPEGYGWKGSFFELCLPITHSDQEVDEVIRDICQEQ